MTMIHHRHVHETPYERTLRIIMSESSPGWVSFTEMAAFSEDHYDYILERMHGSMAQSAILPPQKKECMFGKEDKHASKP